MQIHVSLFDSVQRSMCWPSVRTGRKSGGMSGLPEPRTLLLWGASKARSGWDVLFVPSLLALELIRRRMSSIKHTVMILSGKGGVGKSTVSSQIAFSLASQGFQERVLHQSSCDRWESSISISAVPAFLA